MKKRNSTSLRRGPEFKGVVKKISGRLTNRPDVEAEGRAEMRGARRAGASKRSARPTPLNPDPYHRG
jgi:hypothetical protein